MCNVSLTVCSLFSMFTMEVILSTAFGRALGVQDGEGGEVYADARDLFKFMHGGSATAGKIVQHLISTFYIVKYMCIHINSP